MTKTMKPEYKDPRKKKKYRNSAQKETEVQKTQHDYYFMLQKDLNKLS